MACSDFTGLEGRNTASTAIVFQLPPGGRGDSRLFHVRPEALRGRRPMTRNSFAKKSSPSVQRDVAATPYGSSGGWSMNPRVIKRSIVIQGRRTSVSLEEPFWQGLKDIASGRATSVSNLVGDFHGGRYRGNLSSGLRMFVLNHYRAKSCDHDARRPSASRECDGPTNPGVESGSVRHLGA
jgi:predicted DNA-binding ribbon-helix-helix protein